MNDATSVYSRVWCKVKKNDRYDKLKTVGNIGTCRWDMSIPLVDWNADNIRSLKETIACSQLPKSTSVSARLGVKHKPLILLKTDHIIPDELHLFLRIPDILIRNLILHAVEEDLVARHHQQPDTSLSTMLECVKECGITFHVWQNNAKDKYEFTSLRGNDKKS